MPSAAEVHWRTDYGKARQEALEKGRPLVLDFATVNCYWCKQLEQRTFVDAAVVTLLNEHCIPLHIDAARSPDLIEKMNIQNYPTLVYAAPDGRILGYQEGFIEAPAFREQVQRAINAASTPEWMNRDFAEATKAAAQKEYPRRPGAVEKHHGRRQGTGSADESAAAGSAGGATSGGAVGRRQTASGQRRHHGSDEIGRRSDETIRRAPAAREAKDLVATLTSRTQVGDQQRRDRARDLLTQAREDYRTQQFLCCLDRCEVLINQYAELPEGAEAAQMASDIKSNAEWAKIACDQMSDRLGVLYLALADTCLKKGQPQQAVHYLERVMQNFPTSRHAEAAQVRLSQIQGGPPAPSVDFKK